MSMIGKNTKIQNNNLMSIPNIRSYQLIILERSKFFILFLTIIILLAFGPIQKTIEV